MPQRKPIRISPSLRHLRSCLFATAHREATDRVLIQFTNNVPDPRLDVTFLDAIHARFGYIGFRGHFLIRADENGTIEQGRPFLSRAALKSSLDALGTVLILVVGGKNEDGQRVYTKTAAQEESLEWLLQLIANYAQRDIEVTDLTEPSARELEAMLEQEEEHDHEEHDEAEGDDEFPDEHGGCLTAAE